MPLISINIKYLRIIILDGVLFLISIPGQTTYSAMLISDVQYSDSTIPHVTHCSSQVCSLIPITYSSLDWHSEYKYSENSL